METAVIGKIAVSAAPYSIDKPYDYLIPDNMLEQALPGVRVTVPFGRGNRITEGILLSVDHGPKTPGLKELRSVLDQEPVLDEDGIALALWMRQRYFCTFFEAVKVILPAGLWYHIKESWSLAPAMEAEEQLRLAQHVPGGEDVVTFLQDCGGQAEEGTLSQRWGTEVRNTLKGLEKAGIIEKRTDARRKIHDKTCRMAELAVEAEDALAVVEPRRRSAPMRYEVVRLLASAGRTSVADINYFTGASMATLRSLEKSGLLCFSEEEQLRFTVPEHVQPGAPIVLNHEQQEALESILSHRGPSVTLLQGVTGSGKTLVYLRLVQEILSQKKTAMVLVPEIVLTPQMMEKFSSYFGNKVVMLHSSLRMSERYDQWKRIRRGEVEVVLGTRSAIFAPLPRLGLIIMDEEQESGYDSENPPRYHTRDVAKFLCARQGATLVLGSATPTIETAFFAKRGIYHTALLQSRYNQQELPQVLIADLRQELRRGNAGAVSLILQEEIKKNLQKGEQSILLLNRRGNSRYVICGECGYVPQCPRCSTALTYHSANGRLMCHYCGYSQRFVNRCMQCGGILKHVGIGTQKVEEELHTLFPDTKILRMDADTTAGGHEKLLQTFIRDQIPILLGTQMVAKGLDIENVTLVGVLSADLSLYLEHYRASERTFSLLTQVVGRAGRGEKKGRAVIQTYTLDNDVIQYAARQDYEGFYESEIRLRRARRYPPFADLFVFTVSGTEEGRVLRAAAALRDTLRGLCQEEREMASSSPEVLGPAPVPVLKVNNRYRYHCTLIGRNDKATRSCIRHVLKAFAGDSANRGLNIFVDCNPCS